MKLVIVDLGISNLGSICRALSRLDHEICVVDNHRSLRESNGIMILPGVGSFGAAVEVLENTGLRDSLTQMASEGRGLLGICLGMQLLLTCSEEAQGVPGLNLIEGIARKFDKRGGLKVPHMGFNSVEIAPPAFEEFSLYAGRDFYFVHSYYVDMVKPEEIFLYTSYGHRFASGISRDNLIGVQFHPEKSQDVGVNFLNQCIERLSVYA